MKSLTKFKGTFLIIEKLGGPWPQQLIEWFCPSQRMQISNAWDYCITCSTVNCSALSNYCKYLDTKTLACLNYSWLLFFTSQVTKFIISVIIVTISYSFLTHTLGESKSVPDSRWDKLSWNQTFASPKLLPVTGLLSTSQSKRFLNWGASCCSEPNRDKIVFGEGLDLFLFILIF